MLKVSYIDKEMVNGTYRKYVEWQKISVANTSAYSYYLKGVTPAI